MEILIMLAYCKAPANSLTNVKYKTAWWLKKNKKPCLWEGVSGLAAEINPPPIKCKGMFQSILTFVIPLGTLLQNYLFSSVIVLSEPETAVIPR